MNPAVRIRPIKAEDFSIHLLNAAIFGEGERAGELQSLRERSPSSVVSSAVAAAEALMRNNLDKSISVPEMAQAAGCSPSHLARLFRRELNMPPYQYLLRLRLELARRLLRQTDIPIVEVALDAGFCSQEHMTRLFKQNGVLTPSTYRKHFRFKERGTKRAL